MNNAVMQQGLGIRVTWNWKLLAAKNIYGKSFC